jgi:hypothetical protein
LAHSLENLEAILELVTSAHIQDRVRKLLRKRNVVEGDENVGLRSFDVGIKLALAYFVSTHTSLNRILSLWNRK